MFKTITYVQKNNLYQYIHFFNTSSVHKVLEDIINAVVKSERKQKNENERRKKRKK